MVGSGSNCSDRLSQYEWRDYRFTRCADEVSIIIFRARSEYAVIPRFDSEIPSRCRECAPLRRRTIVGLLGSDTVVRLPKAGFLASEGDLDGHNGRRLFTRLIPKPTQQQLGSSLRGHWA